MTKRLIKIADKIRKEQKQVLESYDDHKKYFHRNNRYRFYIPSSIGARLRQLEQKN